MFGKKKVTGDRDKPFTPILLGCSFCNKSQHDVKKLIAGPKVQICDECVDICHDVLSEEKKDSVRASAVEGQWPASGTLLVCGLCRTPITLDQSLAVPDRGIICAGCVGAFEAALGERNEQS